MKICLIPARIGSKRIKEKNILNFYGKPLIYYSINNAIKSKIFDKIYVSTDSKKIKKIVEIYNAEVPYLRPKTLSNDEAIDNKVINFHLKKVKEKITYLCYLYPTSPMLRPKDLVNSFNFFKKKKINYLLSVKKFEKKNEKKILNIFSQKKKEKSKFIDIGQFYWFKLNNKNFDIENERKKLKFGWQLPANFIDLNTNSDLKKLKFNFKNR